MNKLKESVLRLPGSILDHVQRPGAGGELGF